MYISFYRISAFLYHKLIYISDNSFFIEINFSFLQLTFNFFVYFLNFILVFYYLFSLRTIIISFLEPFLFFFSFLYILSFLFIFSIFFVLNILNFLFFCIFVDSNLSSLILLVNSGMVN